MDRSGRGRERREREIYIYIFRKEKCLNCNTVKSYPLLLNNNNEIWRKTSTIIFRSNIWKQKKYMKIISEYKARNTLSYCLSNENTYIIKFLKRLIYFGLHIYIFLSHLNTYSTTLEYRFKIRSAN